MDRGLLLAVPLDSVLVRVAVAVLLGALFGHILYRLSLKSARARFCAAFIPIAAVLSTVAVSINAPFMPVLMVPTSAGAVLPVPVEYGYLDFAPLSVPFLLGAWAMGAAALLGRRALSLLASSRSRRTTRIAPQSLQAVVDATAAQLGIKPPAVAVVDECRGGAYVTGLRSPTLVISHRLYEKLDDDELAGMVAHELSHIARRDLWTALVVGVVKDVLFFVPGRAWADRALHREREHAADERAVAITGKPAALASSMLKAVELSGGHAPSHAAALVPHGEFVRRIDNLLDPQVVSRTRHRVEVMVVGVVSLATMLAAMSFAQVFRADGVPRDSVAVMWTNMRAPQALNQTESRVFAAYRTVNPTAVTEASTPVRTHIERQSDNRPSTYVACIETACPSPHRAVSLGIVPQRDAALRPPAQHVLRDTPVRPGPGSNLHVFWVGTDTAE